MDLLHHVRVINMCYSGKGEDYYMLFVFAGSFFFFKKKILFLMFAFFCIFYVAHLGYLAWRMLWPRIVHTSK